MDPTLTFILQAGLALLMLVFGFILNSMRASMEQFRVDLKLLNDAVLGKYVTLEASEQWRIAHILEESRRWELQRSLDHELRGHIQTLRIDFERANLGRTQQ